MGDPLQRVRSGDPIPARAATWNAILDAALAHQRRKLGDAGGPLDADVIDPANTILVKNPNSSITAWPAFSVLAYGDPVGPSPEDGVGERHAVQERPCFQGATPTDPCDPFVITLEPIAGQKIGRAACAGAVVVQIAVSDEAHTHARPLAGTTAHLISSGVGVPVVWKESGTGTKWAIVLLGGCSGVALGGNYYAVNPLAEFFDAPDTDRSFCLVGSSYVVARATVAKIPAGMGVLLFATANFEVCYTLGESDFTTGGGQTVSGPGPTPITGDYGFFSVDFRTVMFSGDPLGGSPGPELGFPGPGGVVVKGGAHQIRVSAGTSVGQIWLPWGDLTSVPADRCVEGAQTAGVFLGGIYSGVVAGYPMYYEPAAYDRWAAIQMTASGVSYSNVTDRGCAIHVLPVCGVIPATRPGTCTPYSGGSPPPPPTTSYNCVGGFCVEVIGGGGAYATLADCVASPCSSPPPPPPPPPPPCTCSDMVGQVATLVVPDGPHAGTYTGTWTTSGGIQYCNITIDTGATQVRCDSGSSGPSIDNVDYSGLTLGAITSCAGGVTVLTFPGVGFGSTGDLTVTT